MKPGSSNAGPPQSDPPFRGIESLEWDDGNAQKNWGRHRVTQADCEQVLLGRPLVVGPDASHSVTDQSHIALGKTAAGRLLMVAFTIRGQRLWVIFPDLKASTTTNSLRLRSHLLADLKRLANRRDVPYQSLLKVFLAERLEKETKAERVPRTSAAGRTR